MRLLSRFWYLSRNFHSKLWGIHSSNPLSIDEEIISEAVCDPNNDLDNNINIESEIPDSFLEFQRSENVMLAVDAPEIFGMFTDADVKDDGITLTTKVKKLIIIRRQQKEITYNFSACNQWIITN